ncbi:MAG: LptF/LptG family permease [bacterium JZ-2024 1]
MSTLRNKVIWLEFLPFWLFGFLAFSLLVSAVLLLRPLMILLVEFHAGWADVAYLYLLGFPQVLVYSLPLTVLLTPLLGMNRLSGRGELDALFTCGIRFSQILIPPLILGIMTFLATAILSEWVAPAASFRFAQMQNQWKNPEKWEKNDVFFRETLPNAMERVILAHSVRAGALLGVTVLESEKGQVKRVVTAKEAKPYAPGSTQWILSDGELMQVDGDRIYWTSFQHILLSSGLRIQQATALAKSPSEMNFSELSEYVKYLKQAKAEKNRILLYDTQRWSQFFLPFSALIFVFLGTGLGALSERSSSSYGLGLSLLIAFLFYFATMVVLRIGQSGLLHPPVAASLPYVLALTFTISLFLFHPRMKGRM